MKPVLVLIFLALGGCQSSPYSHVQVGPSYPPEACQEVGQVIGNAISREQSRDQAIDDMRYNAAQLDANYVRLVAVTAHGRAARGIAYRCQ